MSSYDLNYNMQPDWWNQADDNNRLSIAQQYSSDSFNTFGYPLQQQYQEADSGSFGSPQVNDVYSGNQIMPDYWVNTWPALTETPLPFALLAPHAFQGDYTGQSVPSAALPPAAFTKEPLAIDQFATNDLANFNGTSPSSFCNSNNQILPISDVPALEYDSTSADEVASAYSRRHWTDSPMADEMDSSPTFGEADDNLENSDPCYAELLRLALMEKEDDHTMLLKDLYEWVRTHSSKAQDPSNKGWQNSVRHNLSMNAAFERVPPPNQEAGTKKTSYWRLTQHAVQHGIRSTTRYRKDSKRKTQRNPNPALIRVQAGAKGGQATRRSVRRQQMAASSPPNNQSPTSDMTRQHSLGQSNQLRQYPSTHLDVSPLQPVPQQSLPSSTAKSYLGNGADMLNLSNPYLNATKMDEQSESSGSYGTTYTNLDWSASPSPIGHVESGTWRMDHKTLRA